MPFASLTLVALHGALGYSICLAFDLPTLLRVGLPLLLLGANILLAPYMMERAYRIDWNPDEPPLDEEVTGFLLEIFQMHQKAPPAEFSVLMGSRASLPIPLGSVKDDAPAIMLVRSPLGVPGLVVSSGFKKVLSTEAQKAAVAHEAYFLVAAGEHRASNALMALPSILLTLYRMIDSNPRKDGNILGGWLAPMLMSAYRASAALTAWTHRKRIYAADAFAVEMTGNPDAMADAVMIMSFGLAQTAGRPEEYGSPAWSPLNLADAERAAELGAEAIALGDFSPEGLARALHWETHNLAARFFEIFSFHPIPSRRLRELQGAATRMGRDFRYPLESDHGYRVFGLLTELLTRSAPWVGAIGGGLYCHYYDWPPNLALYLVGGFLGGLVLSAGLWYPPFSRFRPGTSRDLLLDIDVSESHPVPVQLEGLIVGRDRPGYAFGSEIVIEDGHGQMTVQYRQPLPFIDSAFAYLVVDQLRGRPARIEGWFRRNPSPYVEARRIKMLDDGTTYRCFRWILQWGFIALMGWVFWMLWQIT